MIYYYCKDELNKAQSAKKGKGKKMMMTRFFEMVDEGKLYGFFLGQTLFDETVLALYSKHTENVLFFNISQSQDGSICVEYEPDRDRVATKLSSVISLMGGRHEEKTPQVSKDFFKIGADSMLSPKNVRRMLELLASVDSRDAKEILRLI